MTSTSRLTLVCAAWIVVLGMAAPALAQAGSAAGAAGAPPAPLTGSAESDATRQQQSEEPPAAPSGCPYRNGKLDLIV
jgi:hypothetical protein